MQQIQQHQKQYFQQLKKLPQLTQYKRKVFL